MVTGHTIELVGGIQWNNPLIAFGDLSISVLLSSIIAVLCFLTAGIFIYLYYKKSSSVGQMSKGWKYFFIGLILSGLYQIMKIPYTYEWVYGNVFVLLFLIFQVIVTSILVYGLYLLKKEVTI